MSTASATPTEQAKAACDAATDRIKASTTAEELTAAYAAFELALSEYRAAWCADLGLEPPAPATTVVDKHDVASQAEQGGPTGDPDHQPTVDRRLTGERGIDTLATAGVDVQRDKVVLRVDGLGCVVCIEGDVGAAALLQRALYDAVAVYAGLRLVLAGWNTEADEHRDDEVASQEPANAEQQAWWNEGYRCGLLSAAEDLLENLPPVECPRCAECVGEKHHWMPNSEFGEGSDHAWSCKHCEHTQPGCPACGDEDCSGECECDDLDGCDEAAP